MSNLYGVARISTGKQNIDRQIRNILAQYPTAKIIKETYTGTKLEGRKDFENLLKILQTGDKLVFDSVSRMSRNSKEGCDLYEQLFNKGIVIEFLKEPHINTEVYKQAMQSQIDIKLNTGNKATDELMNTIIEALNSWIKEEMAVDYNLYKTDDVYKTVKEYIKYYNNERLAYSLQYKSPVQYRTELSFN